MVVAAQKRLASVWLAGCCQQWVLGGHAGSKHVRLRLLYIDRAVVMSIRKGCFCPALNDCIVAPNETSKILYFLRLLLTPLEVYYLLGS